MPTDTLGVTGPPVDETSDIKGLMARALGVELTPEPTDPYQNHEAIKKLVKEQKDIAFGDHRVPMERLWQLVIKYILGDQWIYFHPQRREYVPKRLHKWVPKPVTNKCAEGLQAIRAMFTSQDPGALVVRPNGEDPANVTAASVADDMQPLIHEQHEMDSVFFDSDFWAIATGNVFWHTWWDESIGNGQVFIPHERCLMCGQVVDTTQTKTCPMCGGNGFQQAIDSDGSPIGHDEVKGRGRTDVVSSFELGFSPDYPQFSDLPGVMRRRWRPKSYYETHHPELVGKIHFSKSPNDRGVQMLRSLTHEYFITNRPASSASSQGEEGVVEYELHLKPNDTYPQGLIARMADDQLLVSEDESVPGPLPYSDIEGNRLFNWVHYPYERVGGRVWAKGALEGVLQKQDQINQVDSMGQLSLQRTANSIWLEPKGAEVEKFTGEPGLVVKYNSLGPGGGEPKRIPGEPLNPSFFQLREQYIKDFEESLGTFDILKGQRPPNVQAFSAMQLLLERSQSRFAVPLKGRSNAYRNWYKLAIEMEREYGPDERVKAMLGPNRSWSFKQFQNAQLQGAISVVIEGGNNVPKTSLGRRAAMEQGKQMGILTGANPDERFAMLQELGLPNLVPALNTDVQSALQEQEAFETWVASGMSGPSPLVVEEWHDDPVHITENRKWMNSDRVREMLSKVGNRAPEVKFLLATHLFQHKTKMQMDMAGAAQPPGQQPIPGGAGMSMANSAQESGATDTLPQGNQEQALGGTQGPV